MGVDEESSQISPSQVNKDPETWLKKREVAHNSLKEFLKSRGKETPANNSQIYEYAGKVLSPEEFQDLKQQFRFGGKQSLNFWVITGISDKVDKLETRVAENFPTAEEVQDQKGEPYFVETQRFGSHLYISCGRFVSHRTTDPETGHPDRRLIPDGVTAVVSETSDLVHVRTAEVPLARKICKSLARSVDIHPSQLDVFYKPTFDQKFIDNLSEYIEKYVNMTVRVEENSDRAAGSIKFTSRKNGDNEYQDLRTDEGVQDALEQGSVKRGYVKLSERGFAFEINRKQSKLWFRSYEREERICQLAKLIDDVLRQSGGYPQQKLQGYSNVTE
jgi:hypothetical protein